MGRGGGVLIKWDQRKISGNQSSYHLYNKVAWNLSTKCSHSGHRFSRNIFAPICLKSETFAICSIYTFPEIIPVENLDFGYPLINGIERWHHECGHVTLLGSSFWCATWQELLNTLCMCPGDHPVLHWGLKLNLNISAGK